MLLLGVIFGLSGAFKLVEETKFVIVCGIFVDAKDAGLTGGFGDLLISLFWIIITDASSVLGLSTLFTVTFLLLILLMKLIRLGVLFTIWLAFVERVVAALVDDDTAWVVGVGLRLFFDFDFEGLDEGIERRYNTYIQKQKGLIMLFTIIQLSLLVYAVILVRADRKDTQRVIDMLNQKTV